MEPEAWRDVLARLAQRFGTKGGLLFSRMEGRTRWIGAGAVCDHFAAFANSAEMADNPRLKRLLSAAHPGFVCDLDLFTREEMVELPIFRDALAPAGYAAGVASVIRGLGEEALILSLEGFPCLEAAKVALPELDTLRPHLARAALLTGLFDFQVSRQVLETLQGIGVPAAIFGCKGRLISANEAFEETARAILPQGRERFSVFEKSIRAIALGSLTARSLPMMAQGERGGWIAHLVPRRRDADGLRENSVFVVLDAIGRRRGIDTDVIKLLFDLTAAESRVAEEMVLGARPAEIALKRGVSLHTIRAQVRSILAKTGYRSSLKMVSDLRCLIGNA